MGMLGKSDSPFSVLIDAALVCVMACSIIFVYIFISIGLAYGLATLVGIWYIDAYLKGAFEYPNETLFADLSFAAFIFFVGQNGAQILSTLSGKNETTITAEVLVTPFIIGLGIAWLGNLRLCRGLIYPEKYSMSPQDIRIAWGLSFGIALISIIVALLPRILELPW